MFTPISAQDTLALRHAVLGPNQAIDAFRLPDDPTGRHYGAFLDQELVAVISLFINGKKARLRQFATLPNYQHQGIGTALLSHAISEANYLGARFLYSDAPLSAAPFLARHGLTPTGGVFQQDAVPYQHYERRL